MWKQLGKPLVGLLKWLGIHEWKPVRKSTEWLAEKLSTYQRRWLIIFLFVTFVLLADGWKDAVTDFFVSYFPQGFTSKEGDNLSDRLYHLGSDLWHVKWGEFLWRNVGVILSFFGWLVLATLISLLITAISDSVAVKVREEIGALKAAGPSDSQKRADLSGAKLLQEEMRNLAKLLDKSGIKAVYDAKLNVQISQQDYADEIRSVVARSTRVRLLTIAGYEYVGRGRDALLYDAIRANKKLSVEVILLDPTKGGKVIKERVEKLKKRDNTYTAERLKSHIADTRTILQQLRVESGIKIQLWYSEFHPVFRMAIADDSLFFSTYGEAHGHESPVYYVVKDNPRADGLSWYESFVKVFDNAKARATLEKLC